MSTPAPSGFACLPMYWFEHTERPYQNLWQAIAEALNDMGYRDVPPRLMTPSLQHGASWRPGLLLGQTCGYPLMANLLQETHPAHRLAIVATPVYDTPHSSGAWCRSVVLTTKDAATLSDIVGSRFAYNDTISQSGYNAPRHLFATRLGPGPHFVSVHATGSHRNSIQALAAGIADACAVDCVSYALLRDAEPTLFTKLRVLATTEPYPGLPLITYLPTSRKKLVSGRHANAPAPSVTDIRLAVSRALSDASLASELACLRILDVENLSASSYRRINEMALAAERRDYSVIN